VSESRVTWATSVPILVFLGLSVLELDPIYATDRRQTKASLNASALWGGGIIMHDQPSISLLLLLTLDDISRGLCIVMVVARVSTFHTIT